MCTQQWALCVHSDLGGEDAFIELTNIECFTLDGNQEPNFIISASTFDGFFSEVRLSKRSLYAGSIGIPPCTAE